MITLDLAHLFNTNPSSQMVPKKVFEWVTKKEKEFPVNYQITFLPYKSDDEKQKSKIFEKLFFSKISYTPNTPGQVMSVEFPLLDGYWLVRITGSELNDGTLIPFTDQDNPKHESSIGLRGNRRAIISGLQDYFDQKDPLLVLLNSSNEGHEKVWNTTWGYKKSEADDDTYNDMVEIRCDRNVNDEWEFRGTIEEFKDQILKPLMN